jgi:hypothetical protein
MTASICGRSISRVRGSLAAARDMHRAIATGSFSQLANRASWARRSAGQFLAGNFDTKRGLKVMRARRSRNVDGTIKVLTRASVRSALLGVLGQRVQQLRHHR